MRIEIWGHDKKYSDTLRRWVHNNLTGGKINPSTDIHNAPNNDMNSSKFGIATASKTDMKKKNQQ